MRGKLVGHRIKYWRRDLNETKDSQYLLSRTLDPNSLIIGLQPNAYYWVSKNICLPSFHHILNLNLLYITLWLLRIDAT